MAQSAAAQVSSGGVIPDEEIKSPYTLENTLLTMVYLSLCYKLIIKTPIMCDRVGHPLWVGGVGCVCRHWWRCIFNACVSFVATSCYFLRECFLSLFFFFVVVVVVFYCLLVCALPVFPIPLGHS